jgi:hypothetical protein
MWTDPGANPGLRDERLVTNCLSHGMANKTVTLYDFLEKTIVSDSWWILHGLLAVRLCNEKPATSIFRVFLVAFTLSMSKGIC